MVQASMALLVMAAAVLQGGQAGTAVANADTTGGANPVRRVVSLLQSMASKLQAEAEKEKELYDKFMCYCKTSGGDLAKSISESTTKVPQLQSDIEQAEASLKQLQQDLKTHAEDRSAAKAAMGSATAQREKEHSQFVEVSTEYTSYLTALNQAIPAIEKGMGGGFVQTGTGAQLRQAVLKDSSVTDYDRQLVTAFLSGSSSDKYVPKSGEITGILNQIKEDFEKNLAEVTSAEEEAVKIHEDLMAAKSKQVSALGAEIERKTTRTGELQVDIVNMKNELTQTEAALVEDKQFAADLDKNCGSKTAEWDEREKTRGEELVAIHDTIKILNDDDALELFKKTLPSPSLLQLKAGIAQRRQKALAALRNPRRGRAELDFVALALSGRKVDFSKVIKMIDDMVALLKNEQLDDEHKKDYCEKQIDMTEDKAKDLNKRVQDLDAAIAEKEEAMTALAAEIKELTEGIAELDKSVSEATEQRKKEHAEFQELMSSNGAAKELLAYAKNRLNKFYNPGLYKEAPKKELSRQEKIASNFGGDEEVASMFVQVSRHSQHANRDAPPAPPGTWDAYSKKSQESAGVIGMIDLLVKDLDREMTEAETSEKEGQKQYEVTMSDAAKKRAADLKSLAAKERSKADFEEGKAADTDSMRVKSKELQATKMYEMQLHQECDWLMENFDLRKQAREEESDSLKQAKAVDYDYDYDSDNSMIQPLPKPADGLPIALLVERGMCTFWEKAEMASRYGPAVRYVIIFDDIVSPDLVPMSSEYNTDMTLLFVSSQSGYELRNFIVRNQPFLNHRFETPPSSPTVPNGDSNNNNSDSNSNSNNDISINGNNYKDDDNIYNDNDSVDYEEEDGGSVNVHGNTEAYGDHTNGILVLIDGERPYIDPAFPALNMAAYFLAAMSGFLAFLIFFGCLLVCAQCGCITAAPDENGRIVLFAGGPGIRHTEGLARMIRVHKLTAEQVRTLDEEEFSTSESGEEGGGESNGDSCCCCICLEEFEHKEKVRVLPCGHKFHEDCLIPWLTERDASCPLCKMDVLEHVLETEKKNGTKDGEGSEVDKERQASDTEAFGNETNTNTNSGTADSNDDGDNNNNNNTNSNLQASRGTSPVRSVWYRLRGWSLIADTAPSDHQGETTTLQGTRGGARRSLEVLSEIEMEDRTTAPLSTVNSNAENVI